jgi:hypothetical protein
MVEDDTGEDNSLKGDTPFAALVESLNDQFDEFKNEGSVSLDKTNYFDSMNNAVAISDQINSTTEYQFDAETVNQMKELFDNTALALMNSIDVDLSQVPNPKDLMYILYTNFILTDQRQEYFNYVVRMNVRSEGLESDLAIAHGQMLEGDPEAMYHEVVSMMDLRTHKSNRVAQFLKDNGLSDLMKWVDEGWLPESVLLEKFLNPIHSIMVMFTNYYQDEKERLADE